MKNLKKVLALVLALSTVFGLSVSASAVASDFTDYDEIQNKEAVEVMNALKVIDGYNTGDFKPNGYLTRAEMCKMVAYVLNGGNNPVLGTSTVYTYTDTKDSWAKDYIEYATSMGIVGGIGHGKFDPQGTLTGVQAAKMMLTAMGYDASVFGFTGSGWDINVNRYANEAGLYDGLSTMQPNLPITRDQAAQLMYNAIQATMMKRSWSLNPATGEFDENYVAWTEIVNGTERNVTLLRNKFNADIDATYMTGYTYDSVKKEWTYTFDDAAGTNNDTGYFGGKDLDTNLEVTRKSSVDYTSMFGQQVKVIYSLSNNNGTAYGVYTNDSSVLATGASGQISDIDDVANTANINGTTVKFDDVDNNMVYIANSTTAVASTDLEDLKNDNTAFTFKVVDNDGDNKADAIIKLPMTITNITYVNGSTVTLGAPVNSTFKAEDVVIYDGYAKGDWVAQINAGYAVKSETTYNKMEVKTGTITGIKTVDGVEQYLIDGVWYSIGAAHASNVVKLNVNDTIDYVAVGTRLFYTKISESGLTGKDVVMVITAGKTTSNNSTVNGSDVEGKLLFSDGTAKVVGLALIDGNVAAFNDNNTPNVTSDDSGNARDAVGHLYTYRIDADGNYELTRISDTNTAGYTGAGNNSAYNNGAIGGYELADDAIVFALTNGTQGVADSNNKGAVYTGREIKNNYTTTSFGTAQTSGYEDCLYGEVNGFNYARVAVIEAPITINTGSNYGYLIQDAYEGREGADTYRYFTLWTENGEKNVKEKSTNGVANLKAGSLITYDVTDTDGVVKNVFMAAATTTAITGWDENSGKIQTADGTSNKVTDETVVIYVDSSKKTGLEGGSISIANKDSAGNYVSNIRYICAPNAAYVDVLVFDVNNKMEQAPAIDLTGTVTVADIKAALTSSRTVYASISKLDNSGAVNVAADQTLSLTGTAPSGKTLTINVENGATVKLNGAVLTGVDGVVTVTARAAGDLCSLALSDTALTISAAQDITVDISKLLPTAVTALTLDVPADVAVTAIGTNNKITSMTITGDGADNVENNATYKAEDDTVSYSVKVVKG